MANNKYVNALRILSADMIEKSQSGHPGLPLGSAAIAYELYANHLKHNPKNPSWFNRDRFVLSAGHGSALLYSLLHLYSYPDVTIDQLKNFRQLDSLTPGHPEYGVTPGVDASTGPLGAGLGMAVGIAMAEAHLASVLNTEDSKIIDHYTYVLHGDGCLMEGISSEVMSLAGTLKLAKLIVIYDSNKISIEGSTDIAFTEDVLKRFEAYGFQTIEVQDGNDTEEIGRAIIQAKADDKRPSFIKVNTQIGYGVPAKQGKASAHGEPLGKENVAEMRKTLEWESDEAFYIPEDIYAHYSKLSEKGEAEESKWNEVLDRLKTDSPEAYADYQTYVGREIPESLIEELERVSISEKAEATRSISGKVLNTIAERVPFFLGGSADLAPSNKTKLNDVGDFSADDYSGRNLHFGVRELGMGAIAIGLYLHGGILPFVSTFFVFSEYLKPMIRLASLMKLPIIYVFTHDSIGVGEDGPTHEPIEQLALFRAQPDINVIRPADENETKAAYRSALTEGVPTIIALSRQNLKPNVGSPKDAQKGAYLVRAEAGDSPDVILLASGSEVGLALDAAALLESEEQIDARVVSVPSMELFEEQSEAYKELVLPKSVRARVAIEAGASQSWGKYVGLDGAYVTIDRFGESAPAAQLFEKFGFTPANVAKVVVDLTSK
ncbi:MAG: transketolase [Clostridiales Family XIII bacterium]|jgi:transketolase|nr:transketolase [Clostridiales Family XIII bacterium]